MIINRKSTFFLGIFIFIIPFLGFPSFWKTALTILSGIILVTSSLKIALPKKHARRTPREKVTPVFVESMPVISPANDTIEVVSQLPPIPEVKIEKPEEKIKPARKPRAPRKTNGPVI